jgi:glycosyltransferase involved in cell wall biosynthesis
MAIMNYPDLRLFKPAAEGAKPADAFVFLYPGTLNRHQGLDIAIRAFARARRHMPDAVFHIYGEGPAKAELRHLIEECQVGPWVKLMERVPLTDVARIMAAADVGVVPKRADGFGNEAFSTKTLEFMACGVPVIVSRTQVDSHYFDDSLVRFFAPGDEADLARAMVHVYERRAERAAWTASARRFAEANSWQERVGDYLRVFDGLVSPDQVAPR